MDKGAEQRQVSRILRDLGSNEPQRAWTDFLEAYSPIILQVVRLLEVDADHIADCFLFVCQQLSHRSFQRLRRFTVDGPASFATWLRAVVRHLCLDWRRKEFGRARIFESIARLKPLDREVFRCLYQEGVSLDGTLLVLSPSFPSLTARELASSFERIQKSLTPRQLWLLGTRSPQFEPLETAEVGEEALAIALTNLAEAYRTDGRYAKAALSYRRVLDMVAAKPALTTTEISLGLSHFPPMLRKMKHKDDARQLDAQIKSLLPK